MKKIFDAMGNSAYEKKLSQLNDEKRDALWKMAISETLDPVNKKDVQTRAEESYDRFRDLVKNHKAITPSQTAPIKLKEDVHEITAALPPKAISEVLTQKQQIALYSLSLST